MNREIHFHQTYFYEVLSRISLYGYHNLKFMKEMRKLGDNFLILCSAPGKLCLLSYPSFNLILAQDHPT